MESLRNLRELYVAVTRAKRRVVVLTRGNSDSTFFKNLECNALEVSEASVALLDFDRETSDADWFEEGKRYFQNENFKVAEVGSIVRVAAASSYYAVSRLALRNTELLHPV